MSNYGCTKNLTLYTVIILNKVFKAYKTHYAKNRQVMSLNLGCIYCISITKH